MGEQTHVYFAEYEFADADAFKAGVRSDEFMAAGKDVADRGLPRPTVEFVELA
jgi:heme-degrading monooxygenase HmoA